MNKPNIRIILMLFGLSFIGFLIFVVFSIKRSKVSYQEMDKRDIYYKRYQDIRLSGKIARKTSLDNDRYSLYEIDVAQSSVETHDLRDSTGDYFLIIEPGKARMTYNMSYTLFVDDSVAIDYEKREMLVFRKGKPVNEYMTPPFSDYYISMRKKAFGR